MNESKENNYGCPEEIREAIERYVKDRLRPGSFTLAVLENDLMTAVFQAHPLMLPYLRNVCMYVYWEVRGDCWGSREKVKEWLKGGGE
jgi:hypothetical protein